MDEDRLYSFVMRGELTKISLNRAGVLSKYSTSEVLAQEYINSLATPRRWLLFILQLLHLKIWCANLLLKFFWNTKEKTGGKNVFLKKSVSLQNQGNMKKKKLNGIPHAGIQ